MKNISIPYNVILIILLFFTSCTTFNEKLYYSGSTLLPDIEVNMKTPGYWISKTNSPDRIIMTREEIDEFNDHMEKDSGYICDPLNFDAGFDAAALKKSVNASYNYISKRQLFSDSGKRLTKKEFLKYKENMNLESIKDPINFEYGIITSFTNQKSLPTKIAMYAEKYDVDFDELQNSAYDTGTPVLVFHRSADNKWAYCTTDLSRGWIDINSIAFCTKDELNNYMSMQNAVTISAKTDIYTNDDLTGFYGYMRMGSGLIINEKVQDNATFFKINLPSKNGNGQLEYKEAFVQKSDARTSYLPYTPRTIILQAFKLLNCPYGWGGMYGEQDCSRFINMVFRTVGIKLPRNSRIQSQTGIELGNYSEKSEISEKLAVLKSSTGGITIIYLSGHIMLYLGTVNDIPFVIHSTWGYREKINGFDKIRLINKTTVSSLMLGDNSKKGSLIKRTLKIKRIDMEHDEVQSTEKLPSK